jgi:acetylornithine deacetylase/succinyl-diaminopimelate desuccinylase-like protein
MGGVGGGAHTPGEFVLLRSLPERAALLAALLLEL